MAIETHMRILHMRALKSEALPPRERGGGAVHTVKDGRVVKEAGKLFGVHGGARDEQLEVGAEAGNVLLGRKMHTPIRHRE
jgi:hypothetical protein